MAMLFSTMPVAASESGVYLGSTLGFTRSETGTTDSDIVNSLKTQGYADPDITIKKASGGLKILGGYQISHDVAVEVYYSYLGKYGISGKNLNGEGNAQVSGFGADVVGTFSYNETIWNIARIGLFRWQRKATFTTDSGTIATGGDSGVKLKLGLGEEWEIASHLRLRIEWEYYTFNDAISMVAAGLIYHW